MVIQDIVSETAWQSLLQSLAVYGQRAYAPYSHFNVACALVFSEEVIYGVNVENASYGLSMCAERNALASAVGQQKKMDDVKFVVIYHHEEMISCCGACRQVMSELLNGDTPVVLASQNEYMITSVDALLPYRFKKEDLHGL